MKGFSQPWKNRFDQPCFPTSGKTIFQPSFVGWISVIYINNKLPSDNNCEWFHDVFFFTGGAMLRMDGDAVGKGIGTASRSIGIKMNIENI